MRKTGGISPGIPRSALALGALLALIPLQDARPQGAPPTVEESLLLGERPDPPRRAPSATPWLGKPTPAPLRAEKKDSFGPLGWFGAATVLASLALLFGGVVGVFDRTRVPRRSPRDASREASRTADALATPPRRAAVGLSQNLAADFEATTPSPKLAKAGAARGPHVSEAITLAALLDELSPRRRRAAALAYGARDLPWRVRSRPGAGLSDAGRKETLAALRRDASPPARKPKALEGAACRENTPRAVGAGAQADPSAKLIDLIKKFSEGEYARPPDRR